MNDTPRTKTTATAGRFAASAPVAVIGGYGAVGVAVAEALTSAGAEVVIAGRDLDRASALAQRLGRTARAVQVDAHDSAAIEQVAAEVGAVVMCVERDNARIARQCLERSVAYVDVSATRSVLASIVELDEIARANGATALVSVGLAPGVSNVLARMARRALPNAEEIDVTLCFGLAGDNGADSRRWIVDGLTGGRPESRPRTVSVPGLGRRRTYPFPFSDQYALAEALGVRATTRMCFESAAVTSAVFALRGLRVFAAARRLGAGSLLERSMAAVHFGTDRFVIQAEARDRVGSTVGYAVTGSAECRATGLVAAAAAVRIVEGLVPVGVHHLDDVVDDSFLAGLADVFTLHGPERSS